MKKLSLIFLFFFLIISVNAETETHIVDTPIDLQFTCTLNNEIPSASAVFNITITDRNGNKLVDNQRATAQGQGSFNYTATFNKTETYKVQMFCTDGTYSFSDEGYYIITPLGGELSTAKATTYIIVFVIGLIILTGFLIMGIYLPIGNKRDEMTGYIIAVRNIKYLKLLFLAFAYLTALVISYFAYTLSYSYLDFDFLTNLFRLLFYVEATAVLPLFILFVYLTITNLIKDSQIKELLSRGLRAK